MHTIDQAQKESSLEEVTAEQAQNEDIMEEQEIVFVCHAGKINMEWQLSVEMEHCTIRAK